uniref:MYND-type domain-containing protein n=1 Tax=Leersia perrieri TaxID=77586 RepID=A0A0D9W443_9ORYZ
MRTRRGACYSPATSQDGAPEMRRRKRRRIGGGEGSPAGAVEGTAACGGENMFEELPDDLVVSILADVAASASSPADLAGAMLTCKRFRELGESKEVAARASPRCLAVRATAWSDAAHRFLQRCANAGNLDACYLLGMIRFYCLGSRGSGAAMMAAAAVGGHREALYSLAVIQFNGSGGSKDDRDLRAGAALCARAASLGHVDALRELGHCLQDGYGVRRSVLDGRRLLVQANARELASSAPLLLLRAAGNKGHSCLLSDFGCHAAARAKAAEAHAANRFLVEWFASRPIVTAAEGEGEGEELRMCSHGMCGRPETRRHEFRRCSVCGVVNYCSRACQALHWKTAHKAECTPMDRWLENGVAANPNAMAADGDAAP